MSEKYGKNHSQAKKEKIASITPVTCEVTGEKGPVEAHHTVLRSFGGPDLSSNYIILATSFHKYVHDVCNVQDKESHFYQRKLLAQKYFQDPLQEHADKFKKKIEDIDAVLMPQFIQNMLNNLSHNVREKVLELTLICNFSTIRDLNMKNHKLQAELDRVVSKGNSHKTKQIIHPYKNNGFHPISEEDMTIIDDTEEPPTHDYSYL